jgi:hypothetical protein
LKTNEEYLKKRKRGRQSKLEQNVEKPSFPGGVVDKSIAES